MLTSIAFRSNNRTVLGKAIFSVKGATAIPLELVGASSAVKTLAKSAAPSTAASAISDLSDVTSDDDYQSSVSSPEELMEAGNESRMRASLSLQPSLDSTVVEAAIDAVNSASPSVSAPDVAPVSEITGVKRLAQRLAFWSNNQPSLLTAPPISSLSNSASFDSPHSSALAHDPTSLMEITTAGHHPLPPHRIFEASPSQTMKPEEIKRSELEPKILREILRLFTHEIYLAYDFGEFRSN